MFAHWLALRSLRHRAGQSVLLGLLSMTAIAACALGPMYERAVEQAAIRSQLSHTATAERGVTILASSAGEARSYLPTGQQRALFAPPVSGVETDVSIVAPHSSFDALAVGRDTVCTQLRIAAGRCPQAGLEVLASTSSAKALRLELGSRLQVTGRGGSSAYPVGVARVVGLYQPFDPATDYWFDRGYSTSAGVVHEPRGDIPDLLHADALFLSPAGVTAFEAARKSAAAGASSPFRYSVDLPVAAGRIGIDDSRRLLQAVTGIESRIDAAHPAGDPNRASISSKLVGLLEQADAGRRQARVIIPTLALQLALVVLVLLALVVAVGVEQRRSELALSRLRGQSRRTAVGPYLGETALLVAITFLPGLLLAWLACWLLCHWWLPSSVVPEVRWPVLLAAGGVALVELALAVLLARRAVARPIGQLLRTVARVGTARGVSAAVIGLAVAALAGVTVALSGDSSSAVSLAAPSMIAILAGLVLSRAALWAAGAAGRRALWRGGLAGALAGLQAARRPGFRRVLTLVCVAVALLISSVDQWKVSAGNRAARAGSSVGAPVVLDVNAPTAAKLRSVVSAADPAGDYAMTVITQRPDGGATPLLAVDHRKLNRIANWGFDRDVPPQSLLDRLVPARRPAPIELTGRQLRLRIGSVQLAPEDPAARERPRPVSLRLHLRLADGLQTSTTFLVPAGPGTVTAAVGGCDRPCTLSQVELVRSAGDFVGTKVAIQLLELSAGGAGRWQQVPLGQPADWGNSEAAAAAAGTAASVSFTAEDGGLTFRTVSHGSGATLQHLDVPINLPCLVGGPITEKPAPAVATIPPDPSSVPAPPAAAVADSTITVHGIDGESAACQPVGAVPFLPRVGAGTVLVDLELAISASTALLTNSTASIWLSSADAARERGLTAALDAAGIPVTGRSTMADQQSAYDQSPPAWSISAALAAGVLAAVLAALMIVIVAITSRRSRGYDLAALRLLGLPLATLRRAVLVEQLLAVLAGVLAGAVVGVAGARLALPSVPVFVNPAPVPLPSYSTAWPAVLLTLCCALVLLCCAGIVAALLILRAVSPATLREGQ